MNILKSLWASAQGDPVFMRKANGWLLMIWLVLSLPICVFLAHSIPLLIWISVYAVVVGHWSAWQAARVEVKQKIQEEQRIEREES